MSLSILAQGRLLSAPMTRTGKSGKTFMTFILAANTEGDSPVTVSGIAFDTGVIEKLATLGKGESIAISGRAKLATWQGGDGTERAGISVVADALLTVYGLSKRRGKAASNDQAPADDLDDGEPF